MVEVIRTEAATVAFDGTVVLDRLDWSVQEEERWVILGPNGAGKTSLLNMLSTNTHPTRGSVSVLGNELGLVDVFDLRPVIGVVSPKTTSLIPEREVVRDAIMTSAWAISGRWHEEYEDAELARAEDLMRMMGVVHLADRVFGTLSDGEKKRALIARALMPNPELLLLDEPATGLDLGARESLVQRLSILANDRTAPVQVMITHHVEEIPAGFTHAMLMRDGQIVAAGQIDATLTDENLTKTFDVSLSVSKVFSRFWAFAV